MNVTEVRCPKHDTDTWVSWEDKPYPEPPAFCVEIVSNATASQPDDATHTLRLVCIYCGFELEFVINLLPEFSTENTEFSTAPHSARRS